MAEASAAVGLVAAVGALVLPEDRVQDVSGRVEGERLLESHDGTEVVAVPGGGELLERLVGARHVRGVVLVVVELHDLARHVRLECRVVVGQVGQGVLGHRGLLARVCFGGPCWTIPEPGRVRTEARDTGALAAERATRDAKSGAIPSAPT